MVYFCQNHKKSMSYNELELEVEEKKVLYDYQSRDIDAIFSKMNNVDSSYHLLYQLPTGGGKTVIFSEIVRRYLELYDKKVVVLKIGRAHV